MTAKYSKHEKCTMQPSPHIQGLVK